MARLAEGSSGVTMFCNWEPRAISKAVTYPPGTRMSSATTPSTARASWGWRPASAMRFFTLA